MDSIRVSEAPDPGSIPGKATKPRIKKNKNKTPYSIIFNIFFYGLNCNLVALQNRNFQQ